MGLFDFISNAGKTPKKPIAAADSETNAKELAQELRDHGITIEKGTISVKGDTVTISGQASSQAEREKAVLILGNTQGIAHVDDRMTVAAAASATTQPAAAAQASEATFYTVKQGDTLSKIAQQFYGDMKRYPELFEANRPMLKDPDQIYPGQVLRIPQVTRH